MRIAFIKALMEMARKDERIWLLVGDVGYTVVEPFAQEFPERYINVGVAEQNMVGIAAGLALCGKVVFVYSIANFPTERCVEHIRNDVCYHKTNVKIVATGGGFAYGAQGVTHHGTDDIGVMRSLPNMTIVVPGDPIESGLATRAIAKWAGPCYLRLVKSGEPIIHQTPPEFQIGKAIKVREGNDATLIATGAVVYNAVQAAEELLKQGIQARVLSMHTIKPLDAEAVKSAARETGIIVTIEEHNILNGLGSAVAEVLSESGVPYTAFKRMGINDSFYYKAGSQKYLQKVFSISTEDIVKTVHSLKKV
jgi:transketolase